MDENLLTLLENLAAWLDTGARALNDVIVHYTGLHCFGETDVDHGTDSDEPYATIGVVTPTASKTSFALKSMKT